MAKDTTNLPEIEGCSIQILDRRTGTSRSMTVHGADGACVFRELLVDQNVTRQRAVTVDRRPCPPGHFHVLSDHPHSLSPCLRGEDSASDTPGTPDTPGSPAGEAA